MFTAYAAHTDSDGDGTQTQVPLREHWVNLAEDAEPVFLAREEVRRTLNGHASKSCIDDSVLIVSELVGNALRHTVGGPDCLAVEVYHDAVVLWVHDADVDVDGVRPYADDGRGALLEEFAEGGRGLLLVEALTADWYVQPTAIGKAVVAVIEVEPDDAPAAG
ncbi:ATP-binding protein [Streptomyces sp. CG1]|uniref:ATP-binding protein n=1 Tax=Streptomyces sp. CG1 TaxID=1287523 RepID=UPI0034E22128